MIIVLKNGHIALIGSRQGTQSDFVGVTKRTEFHVIGLPFQHNKIVLPADVIRVLNPILMWKDNRIPRIPALRACHHADE